MALRRAFAAALLVGLALPGCGGDDRTGPLVVQDLETVSADYEFTIPLGTGAKFDAGEVVEILPAELQVTVGEVMRIVNEDDRSHLIGPFFVGAGETLTQRFSNPGEFIGACTVHPSGQFALIVTG
jgi:plastocyanin